MKRRHPGQYFFLAIAALMIGSVAVPRVAAAIARMGARGMAFASDDEGKGVGSSDRSVARMDAESFAPAPGGNDAEVERWKRAAASGIVIADARVLTPDGASGARASLAAMFGAELSGWVARYYASPREALRDGGTSTAVRSALASLADRSSASMGKPCLAFESDGRDAIILESGAHFDGKAPLAEYGGRTAPLYARLYFNRADPALSGELAASDAGSVELGLTDSGRAALRDAGIPAAIPVAVIRATPFSRTALLNVDVSRLDVETPEGASSGLDWYRTHVSQFRYGSDDAVYWRVYAPLIASLSSPEAGSTRVAEADANASADAVSVRFRARGKNLWKADAVGGWDTFVVKGVNLGPALPGKAFTEMPTDENLYYRWFLMMTGMNLNAVRVYTLLPPAFYRAFRAYNLAHPGRELLLLQEIWPEENPMGGDYLERAYTAEFFAEIDRVVDAVHGGASIPARRSRSWGEYADDVSPWTLGFLVGRELESAEVLATDRLHAGYRYGGRWFSSTAGTPTEAWLASACDRAASREIGKWGSATPVSVVSWPPLDPVPHWVEWRDPDVIASGKPPSNDRASVDVSRIDVSPDFPAGFFGSYHIYPNYPDFMVTTPWYANYRDERGSFRYGGYLREFMMFHDKYPALVAEYGLSTSLGVAHLSPDGLHHGGQGEAEQGAGIARMTKAALAEGYAGTVVFEWIDEWAKKTWTTEPFMIPLDRHVVWRNALDPEQNYGLVAMLGSSRRGYREVAARSGGAGGNARASSVAIWGDESHLSLSIDSPRPWDSFRGTILVALDVADRARGLFTARGASVSVLGENSGDRAIAFPSGCEFLLELSFGADAVAAGTDGVSARLLASDSCNLGEGRASLDAKSGEAFSEIRVLVNRLSVDSLGSVTPAQYANRSILPCGIFSDGRNCVSVEGTRIIARLPWGMLNVSDPSRLTVLDDPGRYATWPASDSLRTVTSDGIIAYGTLLSEGAIESFPFDGARETDLWRYDPAFWDVPYWSEREKDSVAALRDFFGSY
jgi:hypothetical protein